MFKNVKILSWLVVILLASNIAMVVTVLYRTNNVTRRASQRTNVEVPIERRSRFFNEQLGLSTEQMERFRLSNRSFNRKTAGISIEMKELRAEIIEELTKENSDIEKLERLSSEIGNRHRDLKIITNDFYLEMKELCDSTQRERLAIVFRSLLEGEQNIAIPKGQGRQLNRQ